MFIVLCLRRDHKISSFYSTEQNLAQMHYAQFNRIAQVNSRKKMYASEREPSKRKYVMFPTFMSGWRLSFLLKISSETKI